MPIITLIIILAVIGLLLYLVNAYIPMQETIKKILNGVVIIGTVLWLLQVFGVLSGLSNIATTAGRGRSIKTSQVYFMSQLHLQVRYSKSTSYR